jgi:alanine dehydrogenase
VALNEGGYLYAHRYTQEGEPVWGNDGLNYAIIPQMPA